MMMAYAPPVVPEKLNAHVSDVPVARNQNSQYRETVLLSKGDPVIIVHVPPPVLEAEAVSVCPRTKTVRRRMSSAIWAGGVTFSVAACGVASAAIPPMFWNAGAAISPSDRRGLLESGHADEHIRRRAHRDSHACVPAQGLRNREGDADPTSGGGEEVRTERRRRAVEQDDIGVRRGATVAQFERGHA